MALASAAAAVALLFAADFAPREALATVVVSAGPAEALDSLAEAARSEPVMRRALAHVDFRSDVARLPPYGWRASLSDLIAPPIAPDLAGATRLLTERVVATPAEDGGGLVISVRYPDQDRARRLARAVAQAFSEDRDASLASLPRQPGAAGATIDTTPTATIAPSSSFARLIVETPEIGAGVADLGGMAATLFATLAGGLLWIARRGGRLAGASERPAAEKAERICADDAALAAFLAQCLMQKNRAVAVTSLRRGVGQTRLAIRLAQLAARAGARVLLMEASAARARLEPYCLGAPLILELQGGERLAHAQGKPEESFYVAPLRDEDENRLIALWKREAPRARTLKSRFDLVIFDSGLVGSPELSALRGACDIAILVDGAPSNPEMAKAAVQLGVESRRVVALSALTTPQRAA